jgi:restriction system protein
MLPVLRSAEDRHEHSFAEFRMRIAAESNRPIILIDGRRLASLIIEHNVGVAPARRYTLKRMGRDYFESL